jgi:CheY-like chemotaxis protein/tetratricopeptide (TPR) repeat protein
MEPRTDQETTRRWILVVDGDAQTQRILDLSLRNAGFEVKTAGNATEALAWLADHEPDLVVSDAQLAGMDGFELCLRVKQRPDKPAPPFVLLAEPSVERKKRGIEVGADDFLNKPVYVQEVVGRARALLQRRERERLESLAKGNGSFSGDLGDIPLVDLLRTVEANRKSGVAHLVGPDGGRGEIYFRRGAAVDAEVGRLSGRDAVYRLFSWTAGRFEIEWKSIRRKDAVDMDPPALLMEALRRQDEWRRLLADVPPLSTICEVEYRLLAERLAEIPDEVNTLLRLFDGVRTFIQVVDDSGLGDLEGLALIGKLFREGIIRDLKQRLAAGDLHGAQADGWLSDAVAPLRAAPDRGRRDLFGAGLETAPAVLGRTTAPLEPLEDLGRAAAAEEARPRATERINTEAPAAVLALTPVFAGGPLRGAPMVPSEKTLQGVGIPAAQPRPATSPGFAPAVPGNTARRAGLPDVTPPLRAPPPAAPPTPPGTGDGIPEAVVPPDGEPAIVIPFPSQQAGGGRSDTPVPSSGDEPRAVAGEILARQPPARELETRPAPERLTQLEESSAMPLRATDPGLGPEPLEQLGLHVTSETHASALPAYSSNALVRRSSHRDAGAEDDAAAFNEPDADDEIGIRPRARGPLLVAAGTVLALGIGWAFLHPRGNTPSAAGPSPAHLAGEESAAAAPSATPQAEAPQPGTPAAPPRPPASAPREEGAARPVAATPPVTGLGAATPDTTAADLDDRAADPKVARALPSEFPLLLSACRTAFSDKRMKDAEVACSAASDAGPDSAEARALMAHALFNRHRRREALTWAERAVKLDPTQADAYVIIGGVHQDAGEKALAKAAYQKYLQLAPTGAYAADLRAIVEKF